MATLVLLAATLITVRSTSAQSADTPTCSTGAAVPDPANNPGLVSDCETLLASWDTQTLAVPTAPGGVNYEESRPDGLFYEVDGEPLPSNGVDALDSRLVGIDLGQLSEVTKSHISPKGPVKGQPSTPQKLILNLFDDVVFTGIVEHVEPTASGHALWGRLEGVELGTMTMVVNGKVVVGTVRTPNEVYSIRTASDNKYVIRQIDESSLPPLGEPLEAPLSPRDAPAQADDVPPDDGSEIDVMVVYTPWAKHREGGRAAIEALIDLFVAETNQAYANSGVVHRIRLVLREEVEYIETGDSVIELSRLRDDSDGYMDHVHELRDLYAADLVHLVVGTNRYCGSAASVGGDESYGFAFTVNVCGGLTFAHELGHNMGLNHDRYEFGVPVSGSNYGYVNQRMFEPDAPESARWRTIMAYNRQCWDVGDHDCHEVPYFSSPELTYNGDPMGVPAGNPSTGIDGPADAVRTLNDRRHVTANFRPSSTSLTPRVHLALSPYWLSENGGVSSVKATLHRPSSEETVLTVSVSPTDAVSLSTDRTLTIPAGQTVSVDTVTITGVDNGDQTGDVSVTVSATAANSSSLGIVPPEPVALAVVDDETTPVVTLSLSPTEVFEGGDGTDRRARVSAMLDNRSSAATTITLSASPSEAVEEIDPLTIPAGQVASSPKAIWAVNDTEFEGVRKMVTVAGTAMNSLGVTGPESVTLTIVDDDGPLFADDGVAFTFTEGIAGHRYLPEADFGNEPLTYSLSPALSNGVTFDPGPPARIGVTSMAATTTETSYTLTATDADGDTDTLTVSITIADVVCPNSVAVSGYADPGTVADCEALLASRDALRGDQSLDWSEQVPIDKWRGVSIANGRVVAINLSSQFMSSLKLRGTMPSELGSLTNLRTLDLLGNQLTGSIPVELGSLTNLTHLDLRHNQLTGEIPTELGSLVNLRVLTLSSNQLTGWIPRELEHLSNLQSLELWGNELDGGIPTELGNLSNLQTLLLSQNQLTGAIPTELGNLSKLRALWLGKNQLNGGIPSELGKLSNLEGLLLFENQLTGKIPTELGNLSNLQALWLRENQLTGRIPHSLTELNLASLYFADNAGLCAPTDAAFQSWLQAIFERDKGPNCSPPGAPAIGAVIPGAGSLTVSWTAPSSDGGSDITAYDLRHIETTADETVDSNWTVEDDVGTTGGKLQYTLTGLTEGTQYDLQMRAVNAEGDGPWSATATGTPKSSICTTGGAVPDPANNPGLVSDCEALLASRDTLAATATLNWSTNRPIEDWDGITLQGNPARVAWLNIRGAGLGGSVPAELGRLSRLIYLNLRNNGLTGPIPTELGDLTNLQYLGLNNNKLTGPIPDLRNLINLELLYLSNNDLSGSLPDWLGSLTKVREFWLWGNELEGPIPDLSSMTGLVRLKLQSNNFTGGIPASFGDMNDLVYLYLHDNALTGEIPSELGDMDSLRYLWLHTNELEGGIPSELGSLSNLVDLNLHSNDLTGGIPAELGEMTNLARLRLHRNALTGNIPVELGDLENLRFMWLHGNMLDGQIPAELGSLTNLERLWLSENNLSGPIPTELGGLSNHSLVQWRLADNQLSGCVPPGLAAIEDSDFAGLGLEVCEDS